MKTALAFFVVMLTSCSAPVIVSPKTDGSYTIALGTSILEKTADESAVVVLPDGMQIAYRKVGKDQTGVANMAIGTWGTVQGIIETAKGLNEGEAIRFGAATKQAISKDSVSKAKIAADVRKTAIKAEAAMHPVPIP
jgi:hypothetical protein